MFKTKYTIEICFFNYLLIDKSMIVNNEPLTFLKFLCCKLKINLVNKCFFFNLYLLRISRFTDPFTGGYICKFYEIC